MGQLRRIDQRLAGLIRTEELLVLLLRDVIRGMLFEQIGIDRAIAGRLPTGTLIAAANPNESPLSLAAKALQTERAEAGIEQFDRFAVFARIGQIDPLQCERFAGD